MAKFFIDTEFIEDGKTIDLISIALVREDGLAYYAISSEFDESKASQWVRDNVISKLDPATERIPRKQIAAEILEFIGDDKPEFWGYFADYDWVVICQLYGAMMKLPKGWPMFCHDTIQLASIVNRPQFPKLPPEKAHSALEDARWTKDFYYFLRYSASVGGITLE